MIEGTTPHADAPEFLIGNLVKSLKAYGKAYATKNKMPFWIDHIKVVNCQPLVPAEQRTLGTENVQRDPLTGESLLHDSSFVVTCVAYLGSPAAEGGEEGAAPAPDVSARPKGSSHKRTKMR